ncbi:PD-(D/E)XK nuclease family protein [Streptacidiphilus monticola]|uniref:PD-(D/E)XK nuclease family protein n=1 Tax=Streptacidiphilus monticola TaxID=2161674 RepID=A0ABW1GD20_9ACTN
MLTAPAPDRSLWQAAREVDDDRPRSRQTQLGASDTTCQRRAAYRLAGTAPSDDPDKRAAMLGTYIHEGLLHAARTRFGWLVETSVADHLIRGHIDAVQLDEATARLLPKRLRPQVPADPADGVTVEDIKTKSTRVWDRVVRYGATAAELRQLYTYARLLHTAGFEDVPGQRHLAKLGPVPVRTLRLRFVNRDNGDEVIQEFGYDDWEAEAARWWVERLHDYPTPEDAPRDFDGPGLSTVCDHCAFRSLCWPPTDPPGVAPQTVLVHDDADRAAALADYVRGHEIARRGEAIKQLARKKLDNAPAGIYGPNQLSWTGGNPVTEPNVEAMVDLHEDAGIPVPMVPDVGAMTRNLLAAGLAIPERTTTATTRRSINVTAAPTH